MMHRTQHMKRVFHSIREWGALILIAIVVAAAFMAPRYVRTHTERDILQVVEIIRAEQAVRAERTERAVAALVEGIGCMLTIPPSERTKVDIDRCIRDALTQQGFGGE